MTGRRDPSIFARDRIRTTFSRAGGCALALAAFALAGCSGGAELVNMWRDPDYRSAPLAKVYVVALKKDATHRRLLEDAFVAALGKHGVGAVASYRKFADAAPDTQQVIELTKQGLIPN